MLEAWTCTTGTCAWSGNKLKKVQENVLVPKQMKEFCHHVDGKIRQPLKEIQNLSQSAPFQALVAGIQFSNACDKMTLGISDGILTVTVL